MTRPKQKSRLSLGKKRWSKKKVNAVEVHVTFKLPSCIKNYPPKRLPKRLLTPSKSPLYNVSPAYKRIKSFKSPLVLKNSRYKTSPLKFKSTPRSLFGPPGANSSSENEEEDFLDAESDSEYSQHQNELPRESKPNDESNNENSTNKVDNNILSDVLSILSEEDGLDEVMVKFLQLVREKKFPLDNIAFRLWMEVVRWFDCKNTTQMRYSENTKMFWKLGWRMFGGRFIHFMSGYKNREEIVLGMSDRGKTSPETSTINFAVPDVKVLRAHDKYCVVENWHPGINTDIMSVIGENLGHKSACLTYDGKKVKQGLTENSGDVDLIGYEPGLTLHQKRQKLQLAKEEVSVLCRSLTEFDRSLAVTSLPESIKTDIRGLMLKLLQRMSTCILQATDLKRKKEYCKEKLIERSGSTDWRKGKYVYAISAMMAFLYDIDKFLTSAEIAREKLCMYLSSLNESLYVQGKTLNLKDNQCHVELPECDHAAGINTRLIKQRSEEWFDIRRRAMVTGSTLFKALGCEGLQKEKDHFETVVCGVPEKEPSENAKSAMKHGTENEVNGVATIVGKVMPVLHPGSIFFEEGCIEVLDEEMNPFLVVSPDGSLRESEGFESTFTGIEIKCPVMKVHSDFPPRYLLQCLSEIEVLDVNSLLYISWTEKHSNIFKVEKDSILFQKAMKIAGSIYNDKSKKPTKLTEEQKNLKTEIVEKAKNVEFIGTFSSVKSDASETVYCTEKVTVGNMTDLLNDVNTLSSDHYELHRERASEAVVFLVADLDRSWEKEKIRCAPIAWFPKGYSLQTNTMRKIADDVHSICHESNIHIPCESFDGQWHGIVVRSRKDQPLTILQLQKDVWQEAEKTKKSDIVSEVKKCNCTAEWEFVTECRDGLETRVIYTVVSDKRIPKWRPAKKTREQITEEPKGDPESQVNLVDVLPESVANNLDTSKAVLACASISDPVEEEAFATNVDEQTWAEELEELLDFHDQLRASAERNGPDTDPDNNTEVKGDAISNDTIQGNKNQTSRDTAAIKVTPKDAECILSLFKSTKNCNKKHKWTNVGSSDLLEYFTSTKQLSRFLDIELRVIVKYLKKTKAINIKESSNKQVKIEQLAKQLGLVFNQRQQVGKKRSVKTLKDLAVNAVSKIPKHELNIVYAEFIWTERFDAWKKSSPVALDTTVNGSSYSWFYVPEFSEQRQQLEVKCIDSTHLLTRTRRKICKGGIENMTNEPWMKVAKTGKTLLTPIMVQEVTDPMSMDMAVTHFSDSVENVMRENGDDLAADLCCDIRNWWESEDKAGISSCDRISLRTGLRRRLLSYVDFGRFPPSGGYKNGWPQQLWEALLANMDAKILLYSLCHGGTYNTRAFSSMIGETFFSELTLNDKRGQGTVTCKEFGRFICNSIEQLQMRLDPERSFAYSTKRSTAYRLVEDTEVHEHEREEEICHLCENKGLDIPKNINTRNHMFDTEVRKRLPGRRKHGTVSTSRNAVQKGALGVRWEKARTNESKMLPSKRMGLD